MAARTLAVFVALAALSGVIFAQTPKPEPAAPNPPTVGFDFVLPGSDPPHYSIAVEPDGRVAYRSDQAPPADNVPGEPYIVKFTLSEPTRARIFDLTRALHCFQGDFEYHGGRLANVGAKTLKCAFADRESHTTYNYTTNQQLQELTTIFQNISNTLEYGRRLAYLHRYDKLGLEAELKSMEEQVKESRLGELQAVAPVLEKIFNDAGIFNVTRRRAERLLQLIKSDPAARAAAPP
ncbi:MAG: hypothetical protein LAN64_18165 [Acidobacteriia bacterium]|nr:hypothetical protein [Terriglobia bacterium]